jgi:soluble lytic murein transglycosylase-like protein
MNSLFNALEQQESGGRAGIRGQMTEYGRPIGATQMLEGTAREMAGKLGLPWRPDLLSGSSAEASQYQRRLGRAYFDQGLEETGNVRDALHYYHGGPNRRLWGPKTRRYADEVLARVGRR